METAASTPAVAQNLSSQAPPPPAPGAAPPPSYLHTRKRSFDSFTHFQNSPYYKMRAIIRDLRPFILEVLRTPDFRNCKAAEEIREKMKIMMDLYKEMTTEPINPHKRQNVSASDYLPGDIQDGLDKPRSDRVFARPVERISQNQKPEHNRLEGTYIVGGSAFGWNFVTFPGSKSIYYGRTKESFRSANPMSPKNAPPVSSPPAP